LAVGAVLLPVTNLQTLVPVAAWLAPVSLLRFVRTRRARVGLPVLVVVMTLTALVALRNGFFPAAGGVGFAVFVAGLGLGGTAPYARWTASSCRGCTARPACWSSRPW
jgi:apolipoprotein N-acyltransferase